MSALTDADVGAWHVSSVLKGDGRGPREFIHYVQRYIRPQEGRRCTGDIATRTWASQDEAQRAADEANEGRAPFNMRGTYL